MNIRDKKMYNAYIKYKNILSGCRTIYDAMYFSQDIIKQYPNLKNLINGMIHGKQYERVLDLRTIAHTLNILNDLNSRNEIDTYINDNLKNNIDIVQLNALMRVGKLKQSDDILINLDNDNNIEKIFKMSDELLLPIKN
jgi:hypothetical protein